MKKLGLIFFFAVVLVGCDESQEELANQKILFYDIKLNPKQTFFVNHLPCECNGGVYLPASYELVAYD